MSFRCGGRRRQWPLQMRPKLQTVAVARILGTMSTRRLLTAAMMARRRGASIRRREMLSARSLLVARLKTLLWWLQTPISSPLPRWTSMPPRPVSRQRRRTSQRTGMMRRHYWQSTTTQRLSRPREIALRSRPRTLSPLRRFFLQSGPPCLQTRPLLLRRSLSPLWRWPLCLRRSPLCLRRIPLTLQRWHPRPQRSTLPLQQSLRVLRRSLRCSMRRALWLSQVARRSATNALL